MKHSRQLSLAVILLIILVCPSTISLMIVSSTTGPLEPVKYKSSGLNVDSPRINKYPPHVKDMLLVGFPPKEADNSLWKNFNGTKYQSPAWNGVHGSFWSPPLAAPGTGGFKIASPMPPAPPSNRIIAKDLPATSISGSSFDLPKRKDIIQIDLPISRQKKIQYELNPHKINNFERTSYHGSARTIKPKPMSLKRFLQVDLSPEKINIIKNDALTAATAAENKAASLSGQITKNPFATSMIIPIVTTNLQEQPSLKIDYKNKELAARKKALKNSRLTLK